MADSSTTTTGEDLQTVAAATVEASVVEGEKEQKSAQNTLAFDVVAANNTPDCIWLLLQYVLQHQYFGFRTVPPPMPFAASDATGLSSNCPNGFFPFQHLSQLIIDAKAGLVLMAVTKEERLLLPDASSIPAMNSDAHHRVIGICWFNVTVPPSLIEFNLLHLSVLPAYQRRGVGSLLLQNIHTAALTFWRTLPVVTQRTIGARVILRPDGSVPQRFSFWARNGYRPSDVQKLDTTSWLANLCPALPAPEIATRQVISAQITQAAKMAARIEASREASRLAQEDSRAASRQAHEASRRQGHAATSLPPSLRNGPSLQQPQNDMPRLELGSAASSHSGGHQAAAAGHQAGLPLKKKQKKRTRKDDDDWVPGLFDY